MLLINQLTRYMGRDMIINQEYKNLYPRGSEWRKWDLQMQTILDDGYLSLDQYFQEIKESDPTAWQQYITKVGGEENALRYDSKAYFNNSENDKKGTSV